MTIRSVSCTGVILAGGLNSRFPGQNKAMIEVGGQRIIDRIYNIFSQLFQDIIIVGNDPIRYSEWNALIVADIFPIRSSLTGVHAGLFSLSTPYAFITACDAPFLKTELISYLIGLADAKYDAIVPETSEGLQPLCAVYSKHCLGVIENSLKHRKFKIREIFRKLQMKTVSESHLRQHDPNLESFLNINTPQELAGLELKLR